MSDDSAAVRAAMLDDDAPIPTLIERYRQGPARLRTAVEGFSHEQLLAYPVPDRMSAQEVVCHVVDADQFLADRMKRTIATEKPLLMGVDGITYLSALDYASRDLELDFALLVATRAQMAADLERLDEAAWIREAVHSEVGLITLRDLLLHSVRHLEGHAATIDQKRAALGI